MDARYRLPGLNTVLILALLPLVAVAFDFSFLATLGLVLLVLLLRWLLVIVDLLRPERGPELVLDSIAASHFVERTRWCLDRLGVDYRERTSAGVVGVLFTGRTVPRLRFRAGRARASIGNSTEILRYLWGAFGASAPDANAQHDTGQKTPGSAAFLEPTPERLAFEKQLLRYGAHLQVWLYYHLLADRDLTLRAWGVASPFVPWWQRKLLPVLFPALALFIRKTFRIDERQYTRAVDRIEALLGDVDRRLADGRASILGGEEPDFVDLTFAALSGLWLQPEGYGGGRAEACRLARSRIPTPMRHDIERWIADLPHATAYVERLYREERNPRPGAAGDDHGDDRGDEPGDGEEQETSGQ